MGDTNTPETQVIPGKDHDEVRSQGSETGNIPTMSQDEANGETSSRNNESAIGGERSQTGEPGRARDELDEKSRRESAGSR